MYGAVFRAVKKRLPTAEIFRCLHEDLLLVTNEELIRDLQPSSQQCTHIDDDNGGKKKFISDVRRWIRFLPVEVRLSWLRLVWLHHLGVDESSMALQQAKVAAYEAATAILKMDPKEFAELIKQDEEKKSQDKGDVKHGESETLKDQVSAPVAAPVASLPPVVVTWEKDELLKPPHDGDVALAVIQLSPNLQPTPTTLRFLESSVTPDNWACEFIRELLRRHLIMLRVRLSAAEPEYASVIEADCEKQWGQLHRIPADILFQELQWPPLAPRTDAALPVSDRTSTSELFREASYAELLAVLFSLNKDVRLVLQCVAKQARKDPCNVRLGKSHLVALLSSLPALPPKA